MEGTCLPMTPRMRLRLLTGEDVPLARGEFLRIALHPYLLAFYAGIVAFVFLASSSARLSTVPILPRIASHGLAVAIGIGVLCAAIWLSCRITARRAPVPLAHFPLALAITVAVSVISGEATAALIYGDPVAPPLQVALRLAFYIPLVEVASALFMHLLLPPILSRLRGQSYRRVADLLAALDPPARDPAPETLLQIGGQEVRLSDLIRMEAEGDVVTLILTEGRRCVPGPLSGLLAELPDELGVQVHRADWVAAHAIAGQTRIGRSQALRLRNGDVVRVASSRDAEVSEWLARNGHPRSATQRADA